LDAGFVMVADHPLAPGRESEDHVEHPDPASHPSVGQVPHELAARLLESHSPYTVSGEKPLVFAGRLPEKMPFEVPIPDGFVLVGSAQVVARGNRRVVEVVLDSDLSATRVRSAFRDLLSGGEWEEDHLGEPGGGGFARGPRGFLMSLGRTLVRSRRGAPVDVPGLSTVFRDARRQTLIVSADERGRAPTDVRLRLITSRGPLHRRQRSDPEALFILPVLTPPPRARASEEGVRTGHLAPPFEARTTGGSYGGHGWEHDGAFSFVALETELDLPAVTAHYTALLEEAGWSRSDEGIDGPQAWTAWTFSDDEQSSWTAAFTALRRPAPPGVPPPLPPQPPRRPRSRPVTSSK